MNCGCKTKKFTVGQSRIFKAALYFILLSLGVSAALAQSKLYRGAEYRTKEPFVYGKYEARMKSAGGAGLVSSFFTYHDVENPVSVWNEIDVEILGRYTNEIQFTTITPGFIFRPVRHVISGNPHLSFHVIGFEWTPDYVAWFVDGYEVLRDNNDYIQTLFREQKLMMNIWPPIHTDWVGLLDPDILPVYAYYDWIKRYEYTPGVNGNFTLDWVDNLDDWDQERWEMGTHSWPENTAQFTPENVVFKNGYMILCLTKPDKLGYGGSIIVDLDLDPANVVWARADARTVRVFFSEKVEAVSAENISNYSIPQVEIRSAKLLDDGKTVALDVGDLEPAQTHTLTVTGIIDASRLSHKMPSQEVEIALGMEFPIKVNIGGEERSGFLADSTWNFFQEYGATGGIPQDRPQGTVISGDDAEVLNSERENITFFQVRAPNGVYDVNLLMADSKYESPGERVFNVFAEENPVLENLDIVAEAGKNAALMKTIPGVVVEDGVLDLYFERQAGETTLSGVEVIQRTVTSAPQTPVLPDNFSLHIYPNPFNPAAKIAFEIPEPLHVKLTVFDAQGRTVRTLLDDQIGRGSRELIFEAQNLSSGVYFFTLSIDGSLRFVKKALYLK